MTQEEMQAELLALKDKLNNMEATNKQLTDQNKKLSDDNASLVKSNGELFQRVYTNVKKDDTDDPELTDEERSQSTVDEIVKLALGGEK